jgi:hypothetical protein
MTARLAVLALMLTACNQILGQKEGIYDPQATPAHPTTTSTGTGMHVELPWARGGGTTIDPLDNVASIATDEGGAVYVTGNFKDRIAFGGNAGLAPQGGVGIYLAKWSSAGDPVFFEQFGDSGVPTGFWPTALSLAVTGERIIVGGQYFGTPKIGGSALPWASKMDQNLYVAAFDSKMHLVWSITGDADGAYSTANSLAVDHDGKILLTGAFSGKLLFPGGSHIQSPMNQFWPFVAKLDPLDGHPLWTKIYSESTDFGRAEGAAIGADQNDNVLVAGYFAKCTLSLDGAPPLSVKQSDLYSLFVTTFTKDGTLTYNESFGALKAFGIAGIAADPSGNTILAGHYQGTVDFGAGESIGNTRNMFAVSLPKKKGAPLWSHVKTEDQTETAWQGLATNSLGQVLLSGWYQGSPDLGGGPLPETGNGCMGNMGDMSPICSNAVFAIFDSNGSHVRSFGFGALGTNQAQTIAAGAMGRVLLGGIYAGNVTFADGVSIANGGAFVADIDAN